MPSTMEWIQALGTISQVLFFVVIGVVTVLTYRRALVTILQPMRAEVFKAQVDLLTKLLHHFVGKSEVDLCDEFGLPKTVQGNVMKMAGEYGRIMFDLAPPGPAPWTGSDFPQGISSMRAWQASGFSQDEHPAQPPERDPGNAAVRAAIWAQYVHDDLVLSDVYCEKQQELRNLLESPLMPSSCVDVVESFLEATQRNVLSIGPTLTKWVPEFPAQYHTLDELTNANFLWIFNQCHPEFTPLKPMADLIVACIRGYFGPDRLTDLRWPGSGKGRRGGERRELLLPIKTKETK
jgi:hypothetical protein